MKKKVNQVRLISLGKRLFEQNQDCYDLAEICHQLFDTVAQNTTDRRIPTHKMTLFKDIIAKEFQRSWMTYISFMKLCDDGLLIDAETLCRKLLEADITLSYLSLEPDLYSRRYWWFGVLKAYHDLKEERKRLSTSEAEVERVLQRLQEKIDELDCYPRKKEAIEKRFFKTWSGENLYQMAQQTNLLEAYSPASKLLNYATHISVMGSDKFYNSEIGLYGPPNADNEFPLLLCYACARMISLARVVIRAYGFDLIGSCDVAEKSVSELTEKSIRIPEQ